MEHYAGIDVSLDSASVCIVDAQGKILKEAKVACEPEALIAWLAEHGTPMARIGLEAGPLSQGLFAEMKAAGLPVELLETRHVRAAFKAMPVKTDRQDARDIAQLMRLGWFRPVHCKSLPAQEVRALLTTSKLLQAKRHDVEMSLRGVLHGFGLKVGPSTPKTFEGRVRDLVACVALFCRFHPSHRRHAAIDDELGPGREGGFVRGQIDHERGDLIRLGIAPERHARAQLFAQCLRVASARGDVLQHPCLHETRVDRIAADAILMARAVERNRLGEEAHGPFRGVVSHEVVATHNARYRRHVEDHAAAPFHDPHGMAAAEERAIHVDALHAPPRLQRDRLNRRHRNDPGVVDDDVEPAAARDHPVPNRLPAPVLGAVEPLKSKARSVGAGPLARCGIDVGYDDAGALRHEATSDGEADAAGPARDESPLARETLLHADLIPSTTWPPISLCLGAGVEPA